MNWPVKKLGDILSTAEIFTDGNWVESKDQDVNGSIRLLQLADIGDGNFINKSNRFINENTFIRLKCTEVQLGDILIARMPDPLGRACIFEGI
jgi:type I restriction enzyme S subunit